MVNLEADSPPSFFHVLAIRTQTRKCQPHIEQVFFLSPLLPTRSSHSIAGRGWGWGGVGLVRVENSLEQ